MGSHTIKNFSKALHQLKLFCSMPIINDRDKAGIIQAFEFTYEQSWKSIQKLAGGLGKNAASPKQAFAAAMQLGWISPADELIWLRMIEDRNLTSHTYREDVATAVVERITQNYIANFEKLLKNFGGLE